jgi:hypothetical protein
MHSEFSIPTIEFIKTETNAIIPNNFKSNKGYDIHCVKCDKIVSNKISIYDTGIKPKLSGFYGLDVVPKADVLSKGYILTNFSVVPEESIKITVVKIEDSIPDPELPFCFANLQLRRIQPYYLEEHNPKKQAKSYSFINKLNLTKYRTGNDEIFKTRYKY